MVNFQIAFQFFEKIFRNKLFFWMGMSVCVQVSRNTILGTTTAWPAKQGCSFTNLGRLAVLVHRAIITLYSGRWGKKNLHSESRTPQFFSRCPESDPRRPRRNSFFFFCLPLQVIRRNFYYNFLPFSKFQQQSLVKLFSYRVFLKQIHVIGLTLFSEYFLINDKERP